MTNPSFDLRSSWVEDALIITVFGEVDMVTAPQLAKEIASTHNGARRVVVDLAHTTFFDSSGLNALVHCKRELEANEITFRVVSPSDGVVARVFEITRLIGPLGVAASLDDALVS